MTNSTSRLPVNEMVRRYKEQRALLVRVIKVQWLVILALVVGLIVCLVVNTRRPESVTASVTTTDVPTVESTADKHKYLSATVEPTVLSTYSDEITEAPQEDPYISLGEYKLTAYCACEKCCGAWGTSRPTDANGNPIVYTASGVKATEGVTIAVDPSVIPYGTEVYIEGHTFIAQDTGAACRNGKVIDIYFASHEAALQFGVRYTEVFIQSK